MNRTSTVLWLSGSLMLAAAAANATTCQLGVKGGVSLEELHGSGDSTDHRTGFVGGAFMLADFSKNFGLRVEGLYFMKGGAEEVSGIKATVKLDYIEFPILGVAHVPLSEAARLDFFAGPTLGFNVKHKIEASVGGVSASENLEGIKDFEAGVAFGAGLGFDVGSVVLGVDGRYGIGLTGITDDPDKVNNQGFAVMASLGFPIGHK